MGGLSLWLIPHEGNPFTKTTQELISDTIPRNFVAEKDINVFPPHITVTSDIDADKVPGDKSSQEWLDSLPLPDFKAESNEVLLELDTVEAEDPFFRKMNLALRENANLRKLAASCRRDAVLDGDDTKAQAWAKDEYRPHLSLFYGDTPTGDVKKKIPLVEMKIGFAFGDLFACCGGALCLGGHLALVDTTKPIKEWTVLAKRETPWAMWRGTRNLL